MKKFLFVVPVVAAVIVLSQNAQSDREKCCSCWRKSSVILETANKESS